MWVWVCVRVAVAVIENDVLKQQQSHQLLVAR